MILGEFFNEILCCKRKIFNCVLFPVGNLQPVKRGFNNVNGLFYSLLDITLHYQ